MKLNIVIPESRRLEIDLPYDVPAGPAELIVLASAGTPASTARPLGMDVGRVTIADDFDAPLPHDLQAAFDGEP
ncbi:MAG TPA: type II toxin-antitoxin system Phd/YefM family antitoxin [Polyangia bacterium]